MGEVPLLRPGQVVATFRKLGWRVERRRGSHIILTREGHRATLAVPDHPTVARGTLRSLIAAAGITTDEFLQQARS